MAAFIIPQSNSISIFNMPIGKIKLKGIYEIRFNRFLELMAEVDRDREKKNLPRRGRLKELADRCGMSDRYLSHLLNQRKKIGSRTARNFEAGMGKPLNWMDSYGEFNDQNNKDDLIVDLALRAYAKDPKKTSKALLDIIER